jgi:hypothetical protein
VNRDLFGLLLALGALVVAWLWASGRIASVWTALIAGKQAKPEMVSGMPTPQSQTVAVMPITIPPLDAPTINTNDYLQPITIPNYMATG